MAKEQIASPGGMNKLQSEIEGLNEQIANIGTSVTEINDNYATGRGSLTGRLVAVGKLRIVQIILTASQSAANSPSVCNILAHPSANDAAISCIDITSGINVSITDQIPCGISNSGIIYAKEIIKDHIYAITGSYIVS